MFISVCPEPNRLCLSSFLFTQTHTSILFLFYLFFRVGFNLFPYLIWDLKSLSPCCEVIFQSNSGWLPLKLLSIEKFSVFIRRLINYVLSECQQISSLPMASRIETETQDRFFNKFLPESLRRFTICLYTPTITSWWSNWGLLATGHGHLWWRWWS